MNIYKKSNVARVRIVSDYCGENLNNKFKLRYQVTDEPANFKDSVSCAIMPI